MKSETFNKIIFNLVYITFWIIFIGLCINAGIQILFYILQLTRFSNIIPEILSKINSAPEENPVLFLILMLLKTFYYSLIAYISYIIIEILKQLKLEQPFSTKVKDLLLKITKVSLVLFATAILGHISTENFFLTTPKSFEWSENKIIFFTGIMYVVYLVFKKGLELQQQTDLTI